MFIGFFLKFIAKKIRKKAVISKMLKEVALSAHVSIERNGMLIYPPTKTKFKRLKVVKLVLPVRENMSRFSEKDKIPFIEIRHIDKDTEPIFIFKLNIVHSIYKKFVNEGKLTIVIQEKAGLKVILSLIKFLEFYVEILHRCQLKARLG